MHISISSAKNGKYEYLTGEEKLPSSQRIIIEQVNFTYFPLGKAFEKKAIVIEKQGEKETNRVEDQREIDIKAIENRVGKRF